MGACGAFFQPAAPVRRHGIMALLFYCYLVLVALCIVLPYLFGVRPRSERDWRWLAIIVGFLTWLLAGFAFLRSR